MTPFQLDMMPCEAFVRCCDLFVAMGFANVVSAPGCIEVAIDERYRITMNPHGRPTAPARGGPEIPARHIVVDFNGLPFACFGMAGGGCVDSPLVNERTFMDALERATAKLQRVKA